jgi:hypothetical protein
VFTFLMVATFVMVTTLAMVLAGGEPQQQAAAARPARRGIRVRLTR